MMRIINVCLGFILLLTGVFSAYAQQDDAGRKKIFRAGASLSNITPPLGLPIVGNYQSPLATHIHDELHARSLVLDDGSTRLAFVIVDNVGVDQAVFDEAKRRIEQATGLPQKHILMSATHTHSATSAGGLGEKRRAWKGDGALDEYQTFLAGRITDGVRVAINNLAPARIGWGAGKVPQHLFNRRWRMKEPVQNPFGVKESVVMNPGVASPNLLEPAGPTDPEVSFISVQSREGKPIALLANYSLHYVGGVPDGHISADYFAVFADRIQELLKADRQDPAFVGILSNGTSADVNNINFRGPREQHPPYVKMRIVADDVAREVLRVYGSVQHHDWVPLKAAHSKMTLNVRRATPEMLAFAKRVVARPDDVKPGHPLEKIYAERVLQMQEEWPDQVDIILQTFRIGDLGVAAVPFETFTETGLEVKSKSSFKPSFTISLANGSYGYLPTPGQHANGGYETWLTTNKVQKDATVKIVAELMNLFSTMKDN
ncbi:MAG: neutral/alkaline non-lysosomal ceramidase N-terminal domain-containing protein [Chryseosolibacter sp.]